MSDSPETLDTLAARVTKLERAEASLRAKLGSLMHPTSLWFIIAILLVTSIVTIVAPLDDDRVNAHPDGALYLFFMLVVPLGASMLVAGARILGPPTAIAGTIALVLLNRQRTEVFSEPNATFWLAFTSLLLLTLAALIAGLGVPLVRAVVPNLARPRLGYLEELRRPGPWWNPTQLPPPAGAPRRSERISLRD